MLRAIGGALVLSVLVLAVWGTIQFAAAASATSQYMSERLGYQALVTAPAAGAVALLVGAALGAVTPKGRLRWRILWSTVVFAILAAGWAAYLWQTAKV